MNIAIVSTPSNAHLVDKAGWVAEGFRVAGETVRRVHTLQGLREADRECQLVLFDQNDCGIGATEIADVAAGGKHAPWFQWWRDVLAYYPDQSLHKQIDDMGLLRMMRAMDVCFVKERGLLAEYESIGIKARWLDQACPADMPEVRRAKDYQFDVLVFGTFGRELRRHDAMALARAGFKVGWAGQPESAGCPDGIEPLPWTHPYALPSLASRAKLVLSVDHRDDLEGYCSDRLYLACGMGACVVRRRSPGQVDLPSFDYVDHKGLVKLVGRLAGAGGLRAETGKAARRAVMGRHTYGDRARAILAAYNGDTGAGRPKAGRKAKKAAGRA